MSATIDQWERHLGEAAALLARVTASMLPTIRLLDVAQVDLVDGSRTMVEWLASRLDIERSAARTLLALARVADTDLEEALECGDITVDRAAALVRLKAAGASEADLERSRGMDLASIHRLCADRTPIGDEAEIHAGRYLHMQPTLDESAYKLWGLLTGVDGRTVEKAFDTRSDSFPNHPGITAANARADALTSICEEWLTGENPGHATVTAEIFIDAQATAASGGQRGASVAGGPRIGVNTLEELLCTAQIGMTALDDGFRPVAVSKRHHAIPPAVRRAVLYRDGGVCVIDGCSSRRRLQPHHIRPQAAGADHRSDNLVSLCWYHHHVVIHQMGLQLDPDSPPRRRRFLRTRAGP